MLVDIVKVSKDFGFGEIFSSISFSVNNGDRIGLVGKNGCGKTTLMKMIAGFLEPDGGTIEVGQTVKIGYYCQEICLTTESNAHNYADSPVWWERGDYLKLRNLYVWYDFGHMIDKVESFKVFFRGHNLFSVDSVRILDPEHVSLAYPTTRSMQLGVKLTF